ncbi:MAG TPA: 1-deoxy-D-xylulose-5-phosphate synthase N-terminal domain-containing protein, partial [Candidatus Saccharimonadales bacterium]|nr:1-deoxy-D-xylulose-5-phosphate synthase N-terminal domain-containing protein [Candidatus Saccharimonadales bacterium]
MPVRSMGEETMTTSAWERKLQSLEAEFPQWEKTKDIVDQLIDLMLNYRQSGHPGGSRSKVHALLSLLLSGSMRFDLRHPDKTFNDRFVLIAGHTIPLVYAVLATLHESLRLRHAETGDTRFAVANPERWQLTWEDLLLLRRNKGLPGHAEFEGKTLFVRFNTGPSGHGFPPAVGMALALKRSGAEGVRVFAMEGEGGATAGAAHESMNSAWGLGLDNLHLLLDWNDYGIDTRPASSVVYGTPEDWLGSAGWRCYGAEQGSEWGPACRAILQAVEEPDPAQRPAVVWFRTRKGRGYGKYDAASHGSPHKMNSPEFWETKRPFQETYGVKFEGFGEPAPSDPAALREQARRNFEIVMSVMKKDAALTRFLSDRIVEIGEAVVERPKSFRLDVKKNPWKDRRFTDFESYPPEMWVKAGDNAPNRKALAVWGSWINATAKKEYGRPLFIAMSADLAESTNIAGFAKPFGDLGNYGVYERTQNPEGVLLPQEITEFTNSGICAGIGSVNFSPHPEDEFDGFGGACSTYGSFSYLKYGPMRLYSQLAQDCDFKVGPVIWVAGHSGPETAEDSRTHFGIFSPSVTQLFPEGHVADLHAWEANEVPVLLAAGLRAGFPILALHLTRPPIRIPDRKALGIPSHFEAARGAYVLRDYAAGRPRGGCVVVQGTTSTNNVVAAMPELERRGLNVKIVAAPSPQLFAMQPAEYREKVLPDADRVDAMGVTNRCRESIRRWFASDVAMEYTLSADWDDRWRTGGSVDEIVT